MLTLVILSSLIVGIFSAPHWNRQHDRIHHTEDGSLFRNKDIPKANGDGSEHIITDGQRNLLKGQGDYLSIHGHEGTFHALESKDGNVAFAYNDGNSVRKEHIHSDGSIVGVYGLIDPNGFRRTVHNRANKNGMASRGDVGVDKATAAAAAKLTKQVPNPYHYTLKSPPDVSLSGNPNQKKVSNSPRGYYFNIHGTNGTFHATEHRDGDTVFVYNDGNSMRKEHIHADGTVVGVYSLVDANGSRRTVHYKAGSFGFKVDG
ncbi:Uncharacterised protein g5855 [Pycnogonum litorale]